MNNVVYYFLLNYGNTLDVPNAIIVKKKLKSGP